DVQHGHHGFERGDVAAFFLGDLLVPADGNAAAVVGDGDRAVAVYGDADFVAEAGHGFVDRVGDQLVHQVVHAAAAFIADIHAGRVPDVLAVGEVFDLGFAVGGAAGRHLRRVVGLGAFGRKRGILVFCHGLAPQAKHPCTE